MMKRLAIFVQGAVQGVGFRPFVFRLAESLNLFGWVNNSAQGVNIEIEGESEKLTQFLNQLEQDKPPRSLIDQITVTELAFYGYSDFTIRESVGGAKQATVLPDLSTCSDCLAEIFDPNNRRYGYPFTNCTNCGPRYSIIEGLPYDRPLTTMKQFAMCEQCLAEYHNPRDRRFHAQPNACPACGPQLAFWNRNGDVLAQQNEALLLTSECIRKGDILAIKGLGGFHLIVDARNREAVQKLRDRKRRPHKPLALMYPNLEQIQQHCWVNKSEKELLLSVAAPIVLLRKKLIPFQGLLANNIAVDNADLGVMLPYTPLHHLLLNLLNFPIVATSANLADEPLCTDEQTALTRLAGIADGFLVHDRPIYRSIDDSIARVIEHQVMVLRRARGYAPYPIKLPPIDSPKSILAVGGQQKNTVAIARNNQVYLSQHIGNLSNTLSYQAFLKTINSLQNLYELTPEIIARDLHPHYRSSHYAQTQNLPIHTVQHHYAHILSVIAEHQLEFPVLGVAWDGTGYGLDGTIWGGEFLWVSAHHWQRVAYLKPFPLIGGEAAIKEPRRIAFSLLQSAQIPLPQSLQDYFSEQELSLFSQLLARSVNCPLTSSMGRLFDGVAALLGLYPIASFEGQAAIALESLAIPLVMENHDPNLQDKLEKDVESYCFGLEKDADGHWQIDWQPVMQNILEDLSNSETQSKIALKFHHSLVALIQQMSQILNLQNIALGGGCFQNAYLLTRTIQTLSQENIKVAWPQQIPVNDGGIALGQIFATQLMR